MEATIRKESETKVTLILDGYFDTSVTAQTEKDVEPLYDFSTTAAFISKACRRR